MNNPTPRRTSVTPSSPGPRPSPTGGLRPALTPAPGDVHWQLRRAAAHTKSPQNQVSTVSGDCQLRRLTKAAGVPGAAAIHPHSFRHTFATEALDAGAALQDVQDALGHADPRTTRRYDRSRNRLDKDPTYALAAAMGRL